MQVVDRRLFEAECRSLRFSLVEHELSPRAATHTAVIIRESGRSSNPRTLEAAGHSNNRPMRLLDAPLSRGMTAERIWRYRLPPGSDDMR
jgi:hypothetical protein